MKYYVDIAMLFNEEDNLGYLWRKLYAQIHLALVEVRDENNLVSIGLSFPNYLNNRSLGDTLRVFALTKEELTDLKLEAWLKRLEGYFFIGNIKEVPLSITKFACFRRKQFKTNVERLARRQAKRKGISFEEALKNYEDFDEDKKKTKLPYVNIKSLSSDREMKIFIEKLEVKEENKGLFSTYGLSKTSTVPLF